MYVCLHICITPSVCTFASSRHAVALVFWVSEVDFRDLSWWEARGSDGASLKVGISPSWSGCVWCMREREGEWVTNHSRKTRRASWREECDAETAKWEGAEREREGDERAETSTEAAGRNHQPGFAPLSLPLSPISIQLLPRVVVT